MAKWPPIGGWLLKRVAAHSRFYCNIKSDFGVKCLAVSSDRIFHLLELVTQFQIQITKISFKI